MTGARSWSQQARLLGIKVEEKAVHLEGWRASLRRSWSSTFARSLALPTPFPLPVCPALDAAVGIADEVGRLQEEFLGRPWNRRVAGFEGFVTALRLPADPPLGTPLTVWKAVRRIYETPGTGDLDPAKFSVELAAIARFREREPQRCERMLAFARDSGEFLDAEERLHTLAEKHDLDTGAAFRTAWLAVFPGLRRGRAAPVHLAVAILDLVFGEVRPIALFLEHCGLLTASLPPPGNLQRLDNLPVIDNEIHNARKAWMRLGHAGGPNTPALQLVSIVEALTSERLRSS